MEPGMACAVAWLSMSRRSEMPREDNRRETGAVKYPAKADADAKDEVSQAAAANKRPASGIGLTRPRGEVDDKTHQSDGQNPSARAGRR
jgi:hypothetical protein